MLVAKILLISFGTFFVIACASPLAYWVLFPLENTWPPLKRPRMDSASVVILILGGGHGPNISLPASSQLSSTALCRLVEGVRLYRQIPGARLVTSGFSQSGRISQAEIVSDAAVELGVAPSDTFQIRSPKNTAEEFRAFKQRFSPDAKLIIVTSAYHMRRAMRHASNEGLAALPAPTDYYLKKDWSSYRFDFMPTEQKMEIIKVALHEYAGLIKAKLWD